MATTHLNSLHLQFARAYGDEYVAGSTTLITSATQDGNTWTSVVRSDLVVRSINQFIQMAAREILKSTKSLDDVFARLGAMFPQHMVETNVQFSTGGAAERTISAAAPSDLVWLISALFRIGTAGGNTFLPIIPSWHPMRFYQIRRNLGMESADQPYWKLRGKVAGGMQIDVTMNETTTGILNQVSASGGTGGDMIITYIRSQPSVVVNTDPDIWISDIWDSEIIKLMVYNARDYKTG